MRRMDALAMLECVRAAVPMAKLISFHPIGLVDEYVRFLTLKVLHHDFDDLPPALSPSHPVDAVWHSHMLLPHEYVRTCQALLSQKRGSVTVFKHSPKPRADYKRYERTLEQYEEVFGVTPNAKLWPNESNTFTPTETNADPERTRMISDTQTSKFRIFVKTLTGMTISFNVLADTTVDELKTAIQDSQGTPTEQQRLVFAGRQLWDGRTLGEYKICEDGMTLHMLKILRGC